MSHYAKARMPGARPAFGSNDPAAPTTARLLALLAALYPGRPFTVDAALGHRAIADLVDKVRDHRTAPAVLSSLLVSHVGRRTPNGTLSIATYAPLAFRVS